MWQLAHYEEAGGLKQGLDRKHLPFYILLFTGFLQKSLLSSLTQPDYSDISSQKWRDFLQSVSHFIKQQFQTIGLNDVSNDSSDQTHHASCIFLALSSHHGWTLYLGSQPFLLQGASDHFRSTWDLSHTRLYSAVVTKPVSYLHDDFSSNHNHTIIWLEIKYARMCISRHRVGDHWSVQMNTNSKRTSSKWAETTCLWERREFGCFELSGSLH